MDGADVQGNKKHKADEPYKSIINSLLSVYYYLRVVVFMYMTPGDEKSYDGRSWESAFAVSVLALLTLVLGVMPGGLHRFAETM